MRAILLLFGTCALSGIAIPMPEDVPLLAAGTQIDSVQVFLGFAVAGALGVFCRDAVWFGLGHVVGEGVLRWRLIRRMLGDDRLARARAMVERRGGQAIIISRFLVGFRAPAFLVAGALGVRRRDFVFWDAVGVMISTPLALGLGYVAGGPVMAGFDWLMDHRPLVVALVALVAVAWITSRLTRKTHEVGEPDPNDSSTQTRTL